MRDAAKKVTLGQDDSVLIVTHDHRLDEEVLALCLRQRPRYVGLMGSRRKLLRITQRILQREPSIAVKRGRAAAHLRDGLPVSTASVECPTCTFAE